MNGNGMFLGQVPLVNPDMRPGGSWTRAQVITWVSKAEAIIEKHPDCNRPIFGGLVNWLSATLNTNAVYTYAPEDPDRLNEIFICGGDYDRAIPTTVKVVAGAMGLGLVGLLVYALAKPDVRRK